MKQSFISTALCAIAALALASCQFELAPVTLKPEVNDDLQELHFIVKGKHTKTYITNDGAGTYTTYWKNGDELGAFLSGTTISGSTTAVDMTLTNTADDGDTGEFEGTTVASGSGTFQAFYPSSAFEKGYAEGTIGLNIGTTTDYIQHPSVSAPDPSCDILVSKACDYLSDGTDVIIDNLYFTRLFSILKINLKGSYAAAEEVSWLKFEVSSGTLSGRAQIDLSGTDPAISSWASSKKYAWAVYNSSKPIINHATNNAVYLVVNPTTLTTGTTITVTGETAHIEIEKTISLASDMEFVAGGITVINLTINASDCSLRANEDYTLVTTSGAFEAGAKYVLAFKDGNDGHYEFVKNASNSKNIESEALTVTAGVISSPTAAYVFIAENGGTSGSFKLKNSDDHYICNTGSSTVSTNNDTGSDWIPSFLSASSTYKLTDASTNRNLSSGGGTSAKAYVDGNFKDQVDEGIAIAQYAGAISVFKYVDGRSALSTPTGLSVSDMTVSWTEVANAGSYIVTIEGTDYKVTTSSYTYTGDAGYFDVTVVAVPTIALVDTYKNSAAASLDDATFGTPTIITPILASGGVTASSVTVTWTDDPNAANGYHCEIYDGLTKIDENDVALGTHSVTFTGLSANTEYTVKINGKAVTGLKPWAASSIVAINLTTASGSGAPTLQYTLTPASTGSNTTPHNSYTAAATTTIDEIGWSVMGNSYMTPWRIGGKNISGVNRPIYSTTAISANISQIVITHGAASDITVNSMTVYVCSTAAGAAASTPTNVVASFTPDFAENDDVTINKADNASWANCFYRIVYNVTVSGNSNKFLEFSEVKFYGTN